MNQRKPAPPIQHQRGYIAAEDHTPIKPMTSKPRQAVPPFGIANRVGIENRIRVQNIPKPYVREAQLAPPAPRHFKDAAQEEARQTVLYGQKIRFDVPEDMKPKDKNGLLAIDYHPSRQMLTQVVASPQALIQYTNQVQQAMIAAPDVEAQAKTVSTDVLPLIDAMLANNQYNQIWAVVQKILGAGLTTGAESYKSLGLNREYISASDEYKNDQTRIVLFLALGASSHNKTPIEGLNGDLVSWATLFRYMNDSNTRYELDLEKLEVWKVQPAPNTKPPPASPGTFQGIFASPTNMSPIPIKFPIRTQPLPTSPPGSTLTPEQIARFQKVFKRRLANRGRP